MKMVLTTARDPDEYIGCLTGGSLLCSDTAQSACSDGVDEYTMICGVGTDVDGYFQLGFKCSFRCRSGE